MPIFSPQREKESSSGKCFANLETGVLVGGARAWDSQKRVEASRSEWKRVEASGQAGKKASDQPTSEPGISRSPRPRVHMCAGHEVALLVVRCVRAWLPSPPHAAIGGVAKPSNRWAVMPVCVRRGATLPYRPCLITGEPTGEPPPPPPRSHRNAVVLRLSSFPSPFFPFPASLSSAFPLSCRLFLCARLFHDPLRSVFDPFLSPRSLRRPCHASRTRSSLPASASSLARSLTRSGHLETTQGAAAPD